MRSIGSAHTDPFSALAGAAAALYGPLHGGANEMVLRMLKEIGSINNVPALHQAGQGRRVPPDGIRPPRLQELRSARADNQRNRVSRYSKSPVEILCSTSRSNSNASLWKMITSFRASFIRMLISIRESFTRR
mgnify:CR=1 FL=1